MPQRCLFLRDTLGLGLAYNFYVKPPTGAEYRLLATPQRLTSVNLNVLPVGINYVRAVAIDARYAGPDQRERMHAGDGRGRGVDTIRGSLADDDMLLAPEHGSGDSGTTAAVPITVAVAPGVNATVLSDLLAAGSALYVCAHDRC